MARTTIIREAEILSILIKGPRYGRDIHQEFKTRQDRELPLGSLYNSPAGPRYTCISRRRQTHGSRAGVLRDIGRRTGLATLVLFCFGCGPNSSDGDSPVRVIGAKGIGPGQFIEPRAIATGPDGKLFVIDKTGRVQRFGATGEFECSWRMPDGNADLRQPSGICVDRRGAVLVADTHQHRVIAFDQEGMELFRFGGLGTGPGQFILPTDVAVDRDGFIYVSEYGGNDRVSKFDSDGSYLFSFGDLGAGAAALQRPSGLAIDPDNSLWVADIGNHRICRFGPDGRLLMSFGRLGRAPGELRYPRDVAVMANGNLAVLDSGNDRISYFDRGGRFVKCWGRAGRGSEELFMPLNAAAVENVLFIADSKNHRVVVLSQERRARDDTIAHANPQPQVKGG